MLKQHYKEKLQKQKQQHSQLLYLTCLISDELLNKGFSDTAEQIRRNNNNINKNTINDTNNKNINDSASKPVIKLSNNSSYKEKLLYLADVINFEVEFRSLTKVKIELFFIKNNEQFFHS